jgi:deoxyribodipyrimidine photo-lyase
VPLVVRLGEPSQVVLELAAEVRPALVVGDENPVRVAEQWHARVAEGLRVPFQCVDADVVVPTALFPREEYAARTIRPKIHRVWREYLVPASEPTARIRLSETQLPRSEPIDPDRLLERLKTGGAGEVAGYPGGTNEALARLRCFVTERLPRYATERNEPTGGVNSELSAHLHFGQLSPVTIARAVLESGASQASIDAYLEELIVRRELAINFVARNPDYDSLAGCPEWALQTLAKHAHDPRPVRYAPAQLEAADTHDPLWNAAQQEMVITGRMHNYLRMYWAKKMLEWSEDAAAAFEVALDLNDRYEMDGRDPNGYAGVAWAIGGKHDRPWPERPIFGTVRSMTYESTRKKFDSEAYIARVMAMSNR